MTSSPSPSPATRRLLSVIQGFESAIIIALILLMMWVVTLSALELAVVLYERVSTPPLLLLNLQQLLEILGFFMMVLIGLELLETIKNYLTQHALHVEVVLLVAMIAVSRKVIILDMKEISALSMMGIAILLFSLSGSYYLIKKGMQIPITPSGSESPIVPRAQDV
jgi:uncharacterized membrane protein (DUF373 family)